MRDLIETLKGVYGARVTRIEDKEACLHFDMSGKSVDIHIVKEGDGGLWVETTLSRYNGDVIDVYCIEDIKDNNYIQDVYDMYNWSKQS